MSEKKTCCGLVSGLSYYASHCGLGAKYEHEGQWYCKTHHPPTVTERRNARNAKWNREWTKRQERQEAARKAREEIERRAELHPELLEALCALVLNIDAGGATLDAMRDARAVIAKATGVDK